MLDYQQIKDNLCSLLVTPEKMTPALKNFHCKTAKISIERPWHRACCRLYSLINYCSFIFLKNFKGEKAMTLVKFNDKRNNALMPGFNDVFESILNDTFFNDRMVTRVPAVNISESENNYHVELAAPGLKKDDFKLGLERNQLTISVEQSSDHQDNSKNYSKREYSYSSFVRSFTLPDSADDSRIDASYTDGILRIDIAKREEAKAVRRQIEIK
jgi:HSP20 family protein